MLFLFRESHPTNQSLDIHLFKGMRHLAQAVKHRELSAIYIGNFFFMLAWVASMQFLPAVLIHFFSFSSLFIASTFIGVGALWSLSNFFINRQLAKRFFPANTLNVCLSILFIALLNVAFATHLFFFLFFFYAAVCAASLCWTNSLANVSIKAPADIQGSILGINQSMTSLASMIAPPIGGLFAAGGSRWIYSFTACSTLVALIILWNSQRRYIHQK
jgi:predicted MFS family arabinose efflux permease